MTATATAYIIADDTSIAGIGSTPSAAMADAHAWTSEGTKIHHSRREWQDAGQRGAYLAPCTAALAADVERRGGCIAWEFDGDIACTVAEAESAADNLGDLIGENPAPLPLYEMQMRAAGAAVSSAAAAVGEDARNIYLANNRMASVSQDDIDDIDVAADRVEAEARDRFLREFAESLLSRLRPTRR